MVTALDLRHPLGWLAPGPMWGAFGDLADAANRRRLARPSILRFDHDSFMEELMGALALHPEKLAEWQARWETWEQPMTSPPTAARIQLNEPLSHRAVQLVRAPALLRRKTRAGDLVPSPAPVSNADHPLKLYQPVQNRFYLVSASLVCQRPGLPDRHVHPGKQEQVGFVLRRLVAPESGAGTDPLSWDEYAYVQTPYGPRWRKIVDGDHASAAMLREGEERLPMFSLGYTDAASNNRRLFAGLIPVGRREAYVGAAFANTAANGTAGDSGSTSVEDAGPDTRVLQFALQVTGPWGELIDHADQRKGRYAGWPSGHVYIDNVGYSDTLLASDIRSARERAQTSSWYALLDFVRFLQAHIQPVWKVLAGTGTLSDPLSPEGVLLAYLEKVVLKPAYITTLLASAGAGFGSTDVPANLKLALAKIAGDDSIAKNLEGAELPFTYTAPPAEWPQFLFPLADPDPTYGPFPFLVDGVDLGGDPTGIGKVLDKIAALVEAALPDRSQSPQPDIRIPNEMKHADADAWFAIRCVYEHPNCGPLDPPLLSAPTEAFQMAGFFDPEAPARPIRIPMPIDITPAALRKYNKSATLVVSDMLCGQLKRIRKLTLGDLVLSVLPWPFHKDLPQPGPAGRCTDGSNTFGMLCSLSIPIVTLCALILLLIIVALFDLFFRWLPLLFVCFPVPGFGPKK